MHIPDPQQHEGADALLAAIHDYIEAAQQALADKNMADLSGLDAVVDTLCSRVLALKGDEGRSFAAKLDDLHEALGNLQQQMEQTRQAMESELHGLNARQRASRAYRKETP